MTNNPAPKGIRDRAEAEKFLASFDVEAFVKMLRDEAPELWSAFLEQEAEHGWIKSETALGVDQKLHRFLGEDKVAFGDSAMGDAFGMLRDHVRKSFKMKYPELKDYPFEEGEAWAKDCGYDPG